VLDACRDTGTTFVAFSPVGRGSLCGTLRDPSALPDGDLRKSWPRFTGENWAHNLRLIDSFGAIAAGAGVTSAQLALGWVMSRGDHVVAIPGTASIPHLEENIARHDWRPDAATIAAVDALINRETMAGPRYPAAMQRSIDTEEFAA
jgi:aryl-alcohol dehydrogenase-like predicted oxidoreductase